MKASLVIGSRGSQLALVQAQHIAARIHALAPHVSVRQEIITTTGDRILDAPLSRIGGKGLFTKEIEEALLDGRIDVAVHSMKDLPTELPEGLILAAVPAREDPHDAFVSVQYASIDLLPRGAVVGTSSLRRAAQLRARRPDLRVVDLRGNLDTRLRKVADGQIDAAILACAGLRRLGRNDAIRQVLSEQWMVPAPGQGALALEARASDVAVLALLQRLHDPAAGAETAAERGLLAALGGGCQTPLGALARAEGDRLVLMGCLSRTDGSEELRVMEEGLPADAETIARQAAQTLRRRGADALLTAETRGADATLPLKGKRIVVTRSEDQAAGLSRPLRARGAETIEFATVAIEPVSDEISFGDPETYDWVVFTSANAVRQFFGLLKRTGCAPGAFAHARIAAVGTATAKSVRKYGLDVSVMPERFVAEGVVASIVAAEPDLRGKRFLWPRGDLARSVLPDALRERGGRVTELVVYRTVMPETPEGRADALTAIRPDLVVFTSSSTAANFCRMLGPERLRRIKETASFAAIGPITARTAIANGLTLAVQPATHDIAALIEAIEKWART